MRSQEFIRLASLLAMTLFWTDVCFSQTLPNFSSIQRGTNSEVSLQLSVTSGKGYRVQVSPDAQNWNSLSTLISTGTNNFADSGTPYLPLRFYRAEELSETNVFTGDHLQTAEGDLIVHPINHASFVMNWNGKWIYNDPVLGATPYKNIPKADLILISHSHTDHFDAATLTAVKGTNCTIIAPQAVYSSLSAALKTNTIVMANGSTTNILGLKIDAIPAYNSNHPIGTGNGYVVTIGGKRLYMSGDTGDIAEMKALQNIDMAFVCMNVPYTMTIAQAVGAVRAFRPAVIYPYHYRNQDNSLANLNLFKAQVSNDVNVEVRLRKWY